MKLKEFIEENCDREIIDVEALEKCLAPKKPKTIWDIKVGEMYYLLSVDGEILKCTWNNLSVDIYMRAIGMAFLTFEEADVRRKMMEIEAELIRLGGRRGFKCGTKNWRINYHLKDNHLYSFDDEYSMTKTIYFDTKEDLEKAVETIGEKRIVNEYLNPIFIEV